MSLAWSLGSPSTPRNFPLAAFLSIQPPLSPLVTIHCGGGSGSDGGGEIEGVIVGRTFWSLLPLGSRPMICGSSQPKTLRANFRFWPMMVYGRPSCNIVVPSVGVRKVGVRTELYIVPETTSAILLSGEVG